MGRTISVVAVILTILLVSGAARGLENGSVCDPAVNLEQFVGIYTVEIGTALVTGRGKSVTLDRNSTFQATMALVDEELALLTDRQSISFRIAGEDEPDWHFDPMGEVQLSSEELEFLVGCPISSLPRLIGEGESGTGRNAVKFIYRLIPYVRDSGGEFREFVGSLKWSAGGLRTVRVVKMSRN